MNRRGRMKIPNPALLHRHLQEESDPLVRLRLMVLSLLFELPRSLTLAELCAMIDVPE